MIMYASYAIVDLSWSNIFLSDLTKVAWVYVLIATLSWFIGQSNDSEGTTSNESATRRVKNAEVIEI